MSDHLDSRALRNTDCYGQRFMKPGTYAYALVPAGSIGATREYPYTVEVVEKLESRGEGEMRQELVTVSYVKEPHEDRCGERPAKPGRFAPDVDRVTVEAGDMVLWNSPGASTRPFTVDGAKDFFGNAALTNECGYTHVFSVPGDYEWVDANGSGLRGKVCVTDPAPRTSKELRAWQSRLGEGTLVMIRDGEAQPAEVEVTLGQTVFFAVVNGPGVSITDARLVAGGEDGSRSGTAFRGSS
jgi:plastocyanin